MANQLQTTPYNLMVHSPAGERRQLRNSAIPAFVGCISGLGGTLARSLQADGTQRARHLVRSNPLESTQPGHDEVRVLGSIAQAPDDAAISPTVAHGVDTTHLRRAARSLYL
jgi:hypothetical protein